MTGFLIVLCSFVLLYLIYKNSSINISKKQKQTQHPNSITFYRFNEHMTKHNSIRVLRVFQEIFHSHDITFSDNAENTCILFFHTLDQMKHTTFTTTPSIYRNIKWCYSLRSLDRYCCKAGIFQILRTNLSEQTLYSIFPISYIVNNDNDMHSLLTNFDSLRKKNTIFILKKNVQRQKGCTLTVDKEYIHKARKNTYTIIQHILQNPFKINHRKINIRVYLLIHVHVNNISMYIYKDGFIYYAAKPFVNNSMDRDVNITTGYIDRQIYIDNPLTIQNLQTQFSSEQNLLFEKNMIKLFTIICKSIKPIIYKLDVVEESIFKNKFNILGCDIAVDNDLNLKLMEINKGPDLDYKDFRDKNVKYNMIQDSLRIVQVINDNVPTNFIQIL